MKYKQFIPSKQLFERLLVVGIQNLMQRLHHIKLVAVKYVVYSSASGLHCFFHLLYVSAWQPWAHGSNLQVPT